MAEMDKVLVKYENEATIRILERVCYWEVSFLREGCTLYLATFASFCLILPKIFLHLSNVYNSKNHLSINLWGGANTLQKSVAQNHSYMVILLSLALGGASYVRPPINTMPIYSVHQERITKSM